MYVAGIDIPNAFTQTRVEKENEMAVIKIIGFPMDLLLDVDPEFYGPFVNTDKKGEKLIIVQCMNSIYVMLVASLIYYEKFVKTLKRTGIQLNPYDPCVANSLVKNKQQNIFFHVDDWKLIHQDSEVNDEFINTLRDEYESVFEYGYGKMKWAKGKYMNTLARLWIIV